MPRSSSARTFRFTATVTGSANTGVIWQVDNATGGSSAAGTITPAGVYTAPAALPVPQSATVTAVAAADPAVSATATITLLARPPAGRTYFVAANGSDGNPGTKGAPLRHIQTAAKLARAGDTVLVRQGVYRELVGPPASGNAADGFVTFRSYHGETATVDGTGLPIPGGQAGLFTITDQGYLIVEGFELRNYATNLRSQVPIGIYVQGAGSNISSSSTTMCTTSSRGRRPTRTNAARMPSASRSAAPGRPPPSTPSSSAATRSTM